MENPVVIIGIGEIGGVFARGFLRCGYTVVPARRSDQLAALAQRVSSPALVLVAVAEADLHAVLETIPAAWRGSLALIQNELLPADWQRHGLEHPTVMSIWFEKKKGQDAKILLSSPAWGPGAALLVDALGAVGIPGRTLASADDLEYELLRKNVYILTTNIAGLACGGNVEELWRHHRELAESVAADVMDIQGVLSGTSLDRSRLIEGLAEGIAGDPAHQCMGRSAPARLSRALQIADEFDLPVPTLRHIAKTHPA